MIFITTLLYAAVISFMANSFILIRQFPQALVAMVPVFVLLNLFAGYFTIKVHNKRVRICHHGAVLLATFYVSVIVSAVYQLCLALRTIPDNYMTFVWSLLLCIGVNTTVFWNGILCVYFTSSQMGIKMRLIGFVCGMIPIVNLVVLFFIIRIAFKECYFEVKREDTNAQRISQKICATKYPILLVHGVFFRDTRYFNYWGRIPKELELHGATIFYGNQPSAVSVADSASALKERILTILKETGSEKVNIIAHSKGGLDCRYAISKLGLSDCVASLTTINTPHRGCLFADYLLEHIPQDIKDKVANTYNVTLRKIGKENADFLAAVYDLTDSHCQQLDADMSAPEGVYCQSVGSVMPKATGGQFPLNFSYHLVKYFDGENDGLVSETSFAWGENYILLRPAGTRGISHGDMIDLNRENIEGFDVREFYVELVQDLKDRGL